MYFTIQKDAQKWFEGIRGNLKYDFDMYYFCFIAGISEMRKENPPTTDTSDIVDYFPGAYASRGRLLVALFLFHELRYLGVEISEKSTVNAAISRLVQPNTQNFLSDDGAREFNKYAHGGYEVLRDWFEDRPRSLDTFLRTFQKKVSIALSTQD